jgi:4-amino-4-deoxy-L-arabinose transferase-like glycosyltransferase
MDLDADSRAALWLVAGLTLLRVIALFRTPLELYPDEAQYWLWSRALAFGYHAKPPMIAWAIWASTALGGDDAPWVRMPAVLFQAGAALCAYWIGRRLYGSKAGLAGAALYALAPAVQLSATLVATEAPLLFFLGVTLCAYVALQEAQGRGRWLLSAGVGAALGLAFLSQYAAIYALIGIGLHLALSPAARRGWTIASAGLATGVFAVVLAPHLAWNAAHGFATVRHAADAGWVGHQLFSLKALGQFLIEQFAVFGPIPFAMLAAGAAILAWRRRLEGGDLLLLCFTAPPILIVAVQAFIGHANATWSGTGYLPGAVLVAAWLIRWRTRRLLIAALAVQGVIAAAFFALVLQPRIADSLGQSKDLARARGWDQTADIVVRKARAEAPRGLSAVAVNDPALFGELAYYGRDYFKEPLAAPLKIWIRGMRAGSQVEASAPLTPADGQRVLVVAIEAWFDSEMARDFATTSGKELDDVFIDRKRQRNLEMFVGEGFKPRPRDPKTGHPAPEWTPAASAFPNSGPGAPQDEAP